MKSLASLTFTLFYLLVAGTISSEVSDDHDGPYVYWHDSTTATIFYICQGEMQQQTYEVSDTLVFSGFCQDEAVNYTITSEPPKVESFVYTNVPRIFAVSDIHGEYEALIDLLKNAGVVDSMLHWSWGDGHLVFNGDLFDRGDGVTETLWLVHRLEREAGQAGGQVHLTLGNHENMVLRGDDRYINDKYLKGTAKKSRIRPEDLYGPEMEIGRWLRTKPAMIQLNDIIFVHGGLSLEMVERGLDIQAINDGVRVALDLSSSRLRFSNVPKFLLGSYGPLWYRGLLIDLENRYQRLTTAEVETVLNHFGATAVVVGHTEMDRVDKYYSGRVYCLDVPLDELGCFQALLWEDGQFYRITGTGEREPL